MMKIRKILLFVTLCLTLSTLSCRKDIKSFEVEKEGNSISSDVLQDSLEALYMVQSNVELMLADRIISKNATFVLDISEQEAKELHISSELYNKYVEIVKNMNNTIE